MSNQNQPHSLTPIKKKIKECTDESDFVCPGNIMQYLDQINSCTPINSQIIFLIAAHHSQRNTPSQSQKQVIKIAVMTTKRETIQGSVRRDKQGYFSTSPAASQGTQLRVQLFYLKLNYMLPRQDSETKFLFSPKGANGSLWNYSTVIMLHQP